MPKVQYKFERLAPEYRDLWSKMRVLKVAEANNEARRIIQGKQRYLDVERRTGVPWFVVGCLHMRESGGRFDCWLHNGDPMRRAGRPAQTVNVPAGRPLDPSCTWEDGAVDALVTVERLNEIKDWGAEHVAYAAETFNGFGYRHPARNIPSPYLWGGTTIQKRGKFVRDGVWDGNVMDPQVGVMAVLRQVMDLDANARFKQAADTTTAAPPRPVPVPVPQPQPDVEVNLPAPESPKAEDTASEVKPLKKSKTIFGGILQGATAALTAVVGFVQNMPPWLIAILVVGAIVGLYLVIKGRVDVQKVIEHLSGDDEEAEA